MIFRNMGIREEWKKEIEKKLKKMPADELEKFPMLVKRCPQCHNLSLEFDPKTGKFYCKNCGFEAVIELMK